jgi:hypothetical protein
MPDTSLLDTVPILRELRDDLDAAYSARESEERELAASRRPRRRRRLRLAVVGVVAAVVAAVAAVLPADERGTAGILETAAATAAAQPATSPPPGEYAYFEQVGESRVRSSQPGLDTSGVRTERAWWVARDGSGRLVQTMRIGNDFERPTDDPGLPRWRQAGERWVRDIRFGPGDFEKVQGLVAPTAVKLDVPALPTEVVALESVLRQALRAAASDSDPETGFAGGGDPANWQILTVIEQALAHPLASPQQRSALYEAAARLDGVEAVEDVRDPSGRPASLVRLTREMRPGTMRTEVYFDPQTSATLARRIVTSDTGTTATDTRLYEPPTIVSSLRRP